MKLALIAVAFASATHGYAVSQSQDLYATRDAGAHWHLVARHVWALPTDGLYAKQLGPGRFAVIRDGRTLGVMRDARGAAPRFAVVDARHIVAWFDEGAAAGSSAQALYASADGGRTWRFVSRTDTEGAKRRALPFSCDKTGVGFATPARGFATAYCAGGAPFLYRSDDGGRTWKKLALPGLPLCACGTQPPRFFGHGIGAFALQGFLENGSGRPLVSVYWTRDGGLRWHSTRGPAVRVVGTVQIPDARTVWLTGLRDVYRTTDNGRVWQQYALPFDASSAQLDAVNETVAFALTPSRLWRTTDGGITWR